MMGIRHKMIQIFPDGITPDSDMVALIDAERAPLKAQPGDQIGATESPLYRRGKFRGTGDDDVIRGERDAQIALSPGPRRGDSLAAEAHFKKLGTARLDPNPSVPVTGI
jgi:hypothetical protein